MKKWTNKALVALYLGGILVAVILMLIVRFRLDRAIQSVA